MAPRRTDRHRAPARRSRRSWPPGRQQSPQGSDDADRRYRNARYPSVEIGRLERRHDTLDSGPNTTSLPPTAYEAAAEIDESRLAPNPQVDLRRDWRELWREQSIFRSTEPNVNGLENRCASDWRTESSNLSPSVFEFDRQTPLGCWGFGRRSLELAVLARRQEDARKRLSSTWTSGQGRRRPSADSRPVSCCLSSRCARLYPLRASGPARVPKRRCKP